MMRQHNHRHINRMLTAPRPGNVERAPPRDNYPRRFDGFAKQRGAGRRNLKRTTRPWSIQLHRPAA
jgi:hypothetical protein